MARLGEPCGFSARALVSPLDRPYITAFGATTERRWSCV